MTCQVITQNRSNFIYSKKSVLETTHAIKFLGFVIDSIKMTVNLNPGKPNAILKKIEHFEANSKTKIRELASVIVSLISLFQVAPLGTLH